MLFILEKYLNLSNYSIRISEIEEYYLSHPNFPSLYAITDTLDFLNIPNIAAEVKTNDISALPNQFITLYKKDEDQEFILIENKNDSFIHYIDENKKKTKIAKDEFLKNWTHIVLLIEKNVTNENPVGKQKGFFTTILVFFLALLFVFIKTEMFSIYSLLFLFFSTIGLIVSVFILQKEFNLNNQFADQICGLFKNSKSGCSEVLNSTTSVIFKTLKLSDVSFVYFLTTVFLVLFSNESLFFLPISFLLVFVIGYSVYLQIFKVKTPCNLCNLINGILVATIILSTQFINNYQINNILNSFLVFTIFFSLFLILWSKIKPIISKNLELHSSNISLKKFKRNKEVFHFLLQNNKTQLEGLQNLSGISIGNPEAKNELSLFLSASCKFCYSVFKEALQLEKHSKGNIKITIRFNSNIENTNNPYNQVVEIIMENYITSGNEKAAFLLNEWFVNKLELHIFIDKYKANATLKAKQILQEHYNWCTAHNFNYSPIKIFNSFLLPNEYSVEELKFFCKDF
jgi:uncharacterized membrane protein